MTIDDFIKYCRYSNDDMELLAGSLINLELESTDSFEFLDTYELFLEKKCRYLIVCCRFYNDRIKNTIWPFCNIFKRRLRFLGSEHSATLSRLISLRTYKTLKENKHEFRE